MSAETVEVLRRARALIADPEHWTTEVLARDADGAAVEPHGPDACRWCAHGAVLAAVGYDGTHPHAVALLSRASRTGNVVETNDRDGHAAVLAMYDRAIALAEAES